MEMCERSKEIIPGLLRRVNQLEDEIKKCRMYDEIVKAEELKIGVCRTCQWRAVVDTILMVVFIVVVVVILAVILT